mmetsp:Transcript_18605/g.70646  ORF Transcript_18605/g.70646 Transcript_18605/m.70646 type:complete len:273 (-) Transcript_18605:49-867(-)
MLRIAGCSSDGGGGLVSIAALREGMHVVVAVVRGPRSAALHVRSSHAESSAQLRAAVQPATAGPAARAAAPSSLLEAGRDSAAEGRAATPGARRPKLVRYALPERIASPSSRCRDAMGWFRAAEHLSGRAKLSAGTEARASESLRAVLAVVVIIVAFAVVCSAELAVLTILIVFLVALLRVPCRFVLRRQLRRNREPRREVAAAPVPGNGVVAAVLAIVVMVLVATVACDVDMVVVVVVVDVCRLTLGRRGRAAADGAATHIRAATAAGGAA